MINGNRIITLCGSTRFEKQFRVVDETLTLHGYIVLSLGVWGHHKDDEVELHRLLERVHFNKIDLSDGIIVVNCDPQHLPDQQPYTGTHTNMEIAYAKITSKDIFFLHSWINPETLCFNINDFAKTYRSVII